MLSCMNGYPCFLQSFKHMLFYDVCSIVPLRDVGNKMLPLLKGNVIYNGFAKSQGHVSYHWVRIGC